MLSSESISTIYIFIYLVSFINHLIYLVSVERTWSFTKARPCLSRGCHSWFWSSPNLSYIYIPIHALSRKPQPGNDDVFSLIRHEPFRPVRRRRGDRFDNCTSCPPGPAHTPVRVGRRRIRLGQCKSRQIYYGGGRWSEIDERAGRQRCALFIVLIFGARLKWIEWMKNINGHLKFRR